MLSSVFPTLISSPRTALCLHVCECVRVSLHACTHCRLKSQTGSTSLIPLSRFTAMLMWDLHQNGWCTAQTEPMSQLESLRNGSTHTQTHTHTHTHTRGEAQSLFSYNLCVSLSFSLRHFCIFAIFLGLSLSLSLTHTHTHTDMQTHTHTYAHTYTLTNTPHSPWGLCLWPLRLEEKKTLKR